MKNIIVTGACGFIGSHVVDVFLENDSSLNVFVIDKLTYAANVTNLNPRAKIFKLDIASSEVVDILREYDIDTVVNLAAETHVDNSIENPSLFVDTNISSTFKLIHNCLNYQKELKPSFRFVHISTDEVFGDLTLDDPKFNEKTPYNPSSPYSASKAAGDLLIKSYNRTFGFNSIILHCSNNFGPRQHSEKLIPSVISRCINKKPITVYGSGKNIREWTFVRDFARGIYEVSTKGKNGESYCIGSGIELENIEIVNKICKEMSKRLGYDCFELITFVEDRKGHDFRYAIDPNKIKKELGFVIDREFEDGLKQTIDYYENSINRS